MKKLLPLLILFVFMLSYQPSSAQTSAKGFDYKSHQKMNKKAARWGKHRMKASKGDQLNLKCSVRKSRQASRKNNS
jgi:hypothetical protein